jgi:hypothetical protein
VLLSISEAYQQKKGEVEQQADNLTEHLKASNAFGTSRPAEAASLFDEKKISEAFQQVMKNADREWGGFGRAPKFPQTFTINFLLTYSYLYKNPEALQQALLSLDKMAQGGIYDHIGGGFARYATDTEWLVPHFEKMLYDNALLVSTLTEAYQLTGDAYYREVMEEVLAFVERELMHPEGGFYSALDADSEGEEGKFYVWKYEEVKGLLGEDADLFCSYFDITPKGNWEGKNIPRVQTHLERFAEQKGKSVDEVKGLIKRGKEQLLEQRSQRVRPLLDDKVLLGWNALMNTAYSKAYAATGNLHYKTMAERNMAFLLQAFKGGEGSFNHTWKEGKVKYPAFLDDYAYLVAALLELGQVSGNFSWLDEAYRLTQTILDNFADDESPFFYFTSRQQSDVLLRKKEVYDGATPSGNALMAQNLYRLSVFFDQPTWKARAEDMVRAIGEVTVKYPTSFGVWLSLLVEMTRGTNEIAVLGRQWENYLAKILSTYIPHKIIMAAEKPLSSYPLLAGKAENAEILIYLCKNYTCQNPVSTIEDLQGLLY